MSKVSNYLLDLLVIFYQQFLSIYMGGNCKFYPSCSCYARESLKKDSFFISLFKITWRILRCHPFAKGGFDPVQKISVKEFSK